MENCCKLITRLSILVLLISVTLPLTLSLQVGFYKTTCPKAESIVKQAVKQKFGSDKTITAALLRMHFHDCFVRGCDASLLLDSTNTTRAEKTAGANASVREYSFIDQIKSKLEAACPKTVSCADIIALATRDAVAQSGGPRYSVPTGRRDGLISRASEVNLPGPDITVQQGQQAFAAKGLTLTEMVILLGGGHTVGVAHCNFFLNRISTRSPDPTMDKGLLAKLRTLCRSNGNPSTPLDQNTSLIFDNQYYKQIKKNKGVLKIDQELALDKLSSKVVTTMASNNVFFRQSFVKAIVKMGSIQQKGATGEIRLNCRVVNKKKGN